MTSRTNNVTIIVRRHIPTDHRYGCILRLPERIRKWRWRWRTRTKRVQMCLIFGMKNAAAWDVPSSIDIYVNSCSRSQIVIPHSSTPERNLSRRGLISRHILLIHPSSAAFSAIGKHHNLNYTPPHTPSDSSPFQVHRSRGHFIPESQEQSKWLPSTLAYFAKRARRAFRNSLRRIKPG
ncbi:hypothetical protein BDD12DRAFT_371149 [Trichophaea hybrida]|nr:hypothetical protein BDD12DRAFT_371149 [Trichophaea hybrida]